MLQNEPPVVSVIMPVYQVENFVADAIRSVLAQTFADFELIIVDDGGTDRSMDICARFTDPRIRIVRQANRGLAGARNTGFLHARGRYIALLDSDDMWAPEKLARHVAHLDCDAHIGASSSAALLIDAAGCSLGIYQRPKTGMITARDVFCGRVVVNGSAPVFRREMLADSALPGEGFGRMWVFDEQLRRSEDVECWTRLAVTSRFRFATIDQPLTLYRAVAGSLSADVVRQLGSWEEARGKIARIAPEFIAACGAEARARELRYLARRCVQLRDRQLGLTLICEAISHWPALLWRECAKTATTFLACLAMRLLPPREFARLLKVACPALGEGLAP